MHGHQETLPSSPITSVDLGETKLLFREDTETSGLCVWKLLTAMVIPPFWVKVHMSDSTWSPKGLNRDGWALSQCPPQAQVWLTSCWAASCALSCFSSTRLGEAGNAHCTSQVVMQDNGEPWSLESDLCLDYAQVVSDGGRRGLLWESGYRQVW